MNHYHCGCYYLHALQHYSSYPRPYYLPQIKLKAHTTVLSSAYSTVLQQTFVNPSSSESIKELRYTFPLYDGVSVVGFTWRINNRIIQGVVKEKEQARTDFDAAVSRGETAGLLEQLPDASDVFTTTVGNVPAGAKVLVEITYLGELKHDASIDGLRFTIPTSVAPRYGDLPGDIYKGNALSAQGQDGMEIVVDVQMAQNCAIREVGSPSHNIAVSMGVVSSATDDDPSFSKASATLSQGGTELDKDFVLHIVAKNLDAPQAILEAHPTIIGQRALMTTLVPKFSLPPTRPEIVFICDRSGSMDGSNIERLRAALLVFLKSLPVGVKFNICSFGSKFSFLWPKSKSYSQSALDEAVKHVNSMRADMGGTEMLQPIKATLQRKYKDMDLEVFLVTDGEIWEQQKLFDLLNSEIGTKGLPVRFFTLGIGHGVSHSLIEGVARAGNGFSHTVVSEERLDKKVVRMLKAALSPHVTNYTLEVQSEAESDDHDDFEVVEKVADSLQIRLNTVGDSSKTKTSAKTPISLFDTSVNPDDDQSNNKQDKFAHLPEVVIPNILQAPTAIPPLFPFSRTSVYLLLSPDAPQLKPLNVVLRASCATKDGPVPLELKIPVQILSEPGTIIHQLGAKKAVAELEEGRGWLSKAVDVATCKLIKDVHEGRFEDMVERECVRLGVQFQIVGKWCSFVAIEETSDKNRIRVNVTDQSSQNSAHEEKSDHDGQPRRKVLLRTASNTAVGLRISSRNRDDMPRVRSRDARNRLTVDQATSHSRRQAAPSFPPSQRPPPGFTNAYRMASPNYILQRSPSYAPVVLPGAPLARASSPSGGAWRKSSSSKKLKGRSRAGEQPDGVSARAPVADASSDMNSISSAPTHIHARSQYDPTMMGYSGLACEAPDLDHDGGDNDCEFEDVVMQEDMSFTATADHNPSFSDRNPPEPAGSSARGSQLDRLVALQNFEGSWQLSQSLCDIFGRQKTGLEGAAAKENVAHDVFATALAVAFFENKLDDEREAWEMVVEKARSWLESKLSGPAAIENLLKVAAGLI